LNFFTAFTVSNPTEVIFPVDKTNESNDTANDQDNDINTSQVSESDLIDLRIILIEKKIKI
jgi:hypothetical protein